VAKVGVIVNPVAGIGGRVGLKGSDGIEILNTALAMGAKSESPARAVEALKIMARLKDRILIFTYPKEMGEDECQEAGFSPEVLGSIQSGATTPQDTRRAAQEMLIKGVDLLLFAGGDGTARDICQVVGEKVPALGIPSGVKIHSAVYAVTPRSAGEVAAMYLEGRLKRTRLAEVVDINEDAFRDGILTAKLYGYLKVPEENRFVQNVKAGRVQTEREVLQRIARDVIDYSMVDQDTFFVIGPGTTTREIMEVLGIKNTLLGIDVVRNREVVANDVSEIQLMSLIKGMKAKIVITPIGGQGHIFGRGNQQISPRVINKVGIDNIIVIATLDKLIAFNGRPLLVDTGNEDLNKALSGYIRVTTGYGEYTVYKVGY
jgi:predicted polyphosphate/ATP-dependent NAD kinase